MIVCIADNIYSPLGVTTLENLNAVRAGQSALQLHRIGCEEVVASLFPERINYVTGLIRSIETAIKEVNINLSDPTVGFVFSSTKGDLDEPMGVSARRVSQHFGNTNTPITVSNACISGLHAQIVAMRLLEQRLYDVVVVAGMDVQSPFIVSGFQSFKALSPEPCRPFDADRCGLNLGEAAATMILVRSDNPSPEQWVLENGAVRNDAVHISNPSKTGNGSYGAIEAVLGDDRDLVCISAHGTATLFNDEMEAAAITRAGLQEIPTFSLKGYYGHTMGAAGLLETIISMHAIDQGWIPATRGYVEAGTCMPICVTAHEEKLTLSNANRLVHRFMKLLSGFGGCNAAVVYNHAEDVSPEVRLKSASKRVQKLSYEVETFNPLVFTDTKTLTEVYKQRVADYPKFYKMDPLCKLGFLAGELAGLGKLKEANGRQNTAIVIMNRVGSKLDDESYKETIVEGDEYYPSPSVFVYTLSNIVTGELAIRHCVTGETACYIIENENPILIEQLMALSFEDPNMVRVVGGWCDADHNSLRAVFKTMKKTTVNNN